LTISWIMMAIRLSACPLLVVFPRNRPPICVYRETAG
jgi:hypothetical protein